MLKLNPATSQRRHYSTILSEFPWYSESLVLNPESILAHHGRLSGFEASIHFAVGSMAKM